MSLLNSKFDIRRGYPNGSALAEPFSIKVVGGVAVSLPQGKVVTQELQGSKTVVNAASSPDLSSADPIDAWLVVEGNDDFSGQYVGKLMAVKLGSGVIFETSGYAAGAYAPGTPVSFSAGDLKVKAANEQIIGYVLEDLTATKGTLVISS